MLVLPAEAPDGGLSRRLEDGNIKNLPADPAKCGAALAPREVEQRLVGNGLHKSVAEETER